MNPSGGLRLAVRWMKFNLIGLAGVVLQLGALQLLIAGGHLGVLPGTLLAVEAAVLHNFAWHCLYTWRDRPARKARVAARRLLRFHLSNGMVSLAGNASIMYVLVGCLGLHPLPANIAAILACSLANFLLGDRFVFLEE